MSSKCSNCGKGLSCGCQKRVASNGAQVCTNCITSYEYSLKVKSGTTLPPKTAPTNVGVKYKPK